MKSFARRPWFVLLWWVFSGLFPAWAAEPPVSPFPVEVRKDILFATVEGVELRLDLHLPQGVEHPPLVMFIHGGAWKTGDRKRFRIPWVAASGYAVASINPHFPALRSDLGRRSAAKTPPMALSGASRRKQITSSAAAAKAILAMRIGKLRSSPITTPWA